MMPRDVATRWNSTSDMLDFALEFKGPLRSFMSDANLKLQKYQLTKEEWTVAEELSTALTVRNP